MKYDTINWIVWKEFINLIKSKAEFPVKPHISETSKSLIGLNGKILLLLLPRA